jgi:hypothetical protein
MASSGDVSKSREDSGGVRAHPPSPAHDLKGEFEGFYKERVAVKQRAYARVFSFFMWCAAGVYGLHTRG